MPESFLNRYSVRPCESTRIIPRPLLATPIVAFDGAVAAVAPPPLPPQPAAKAMTPTRAAPARRLIILVRAILVPFHGDMGYVHRPQRAHLCRRLGGDSFALDRRGSPGVGLLPLDAVALDLFPAFAQVRARERVCKNTAANVGVA